MRAGRRGVVMGARSMLRSAAAIVAALGTKVWRLRSRRPGHATVVAYGALFVALGGTALATTQTFILGATNRVNAASEVTNVKADNSQNPIASPLLTLTNLGAGTGASALGLTVASGHPPFTTNSATKVTNLNADKVDGLDSSSFVSTTGFRRVGPGPSPTLARLATGRRRSPLNPPRRQHRHQPRDGRAPPLRGIRGHESATTLKHSRVQVSLTLAFE